MIGLCLYVLFLVFDKKKKKTLVNVVEKNLIMAKLCMDQFFFSPRRYELLDVLFRTMNFSDSFYLF